MVTGKFIKGSILKHIVIMTLTSTVGLLAIFMVDLVDMFFLSLLGKQELAASIGFSGVVLFFMTAACIGCQVGVGAVMARAEGQKNRSLAARYYGHSMMYTAVISSVLCAITMIFSEDLLMALGARGETLTFAKQYTFIVLPSTPLLAIGMCAAAALRSLGDARRAMYAIAGGAFVNAALDPVLIFVFDLGIQGAALATLLSRFATVAIGVLSMSRIHNVYCTLEHIFIKPDFNIWSKIAIPAILTSLATPLGSAIVMHAMADYGVDAVAGAAIVGRIVPVAFAVLFALSGAIGPIIGQNIGAHSYGRVKQALRIALLLSASYVVFIWLVLMLMTDFIIKAFGAEAEAAELIIFYNQFLVLGFIFSAMLFVANAAFNNINKAQLATMFNFSRSLLGILPAVLLLAPLYGAKGVMAAEILGQTVFGVVAYIVVMRVVNTMEKNHEGAQCNEPVVSDVASFSSGQTQAAQQCLVNKNNEED